MQLKIGTRRYDVCCLHTAEIKDLTGREADTVCGFTDYYQSKIVINGDMSKDVKQETLMHEILHTVLDNSGIEEVSRQAKEGANLSELIATILAPRLHSLIADNNIESMLAAI
jgi:Zn-dependent peptidase ImmA (M78 family)